jgi:hypothetical protein
MRGAWIRAFGWTSISVEYEHIKDIFDDIVYILLHASQLRSLWLPLQSTPVMFSTPLQMTPNTLRTICVIITPLTVFDAVALISQCLYVEHLSVTSYAVDWSTVLGRWNLPRMRTLLWGSSKSAHNILFLKKCSLPSLAHLTFDDLDPTHVAGGESKIIGYLNSINPLHSLNLHIPPESFPGVIPFVTAPVLGIDGGRASTMDLLVFLPPAVHTLIIHDVKGVSDIWRLLDRIREVVGSVQQIQITFDYFRSILRPEADFSWLRMPEGYRPELDLESRKSLYGLFITRLFSHAYMLGKRGIVILDAEGRTVSMTHTNSTMAGRKSLGLPLRS